MTKSQEERRLQFIRENLRCIDCQFLVSIIDSLRAEIETLRSQVERYKNYWGNNVSMRERITALEGELRQMRELLKWVRQTIHQAHHDGEIEKCPKNTCNAITQVLSSLPLGKALDTPNV